MSSARVKEIVNQVNEYVEYMARINRRPEKITLLVADHAGLTECLMKGESFPGFELKDKLLYFRGTPVVPVGDAA